MWEYNDLIDAILARMIVVLGKERALKYAGIPVTFQGRFAGKASKQDLAAVCDSYYKVAGTIGKALIRHQTVNLTLKGRVVDLPDNLRSGNAEALLGDTRALRGVNVGDLVRESWPGLLVAFVLGIAATRLSGLLAVEGKSYVDALVVAIVLGMTGRWVLNALPESFQIRLLPGIIFGRSPSYQSGSCSTGRRISMRAKSSGSRPGRRATSFSCSRWPPSPSPAW